MNNKNLIPFSQRSEEEQRAMRSKGGKNSGKTRQRNAQLKNLVLRALSLDAPQNVKEEVIKVFPDLADEELTTKMIAVLAQLKAAFKGDTKAFESLMNIIGELPAAKKEITGSEGGAIAIKKVFISEKEQKETKKHIDTVINDK